MPRPTHSCTDRPAQVQATAGAGQPLTTPTNSTALPCCTRTGRKGSTHRGGDQDSFSSHICHTIYYNYYTDQIRWSTVQLKCCLHCSLEQGTGYGGGRAATRRKVTSNATVVLVAAVEAFKTKVMSIHLPLQGALLCWTHFRSAQVERSKFSLMFLHKSDYSLSN